jgi:hypothetical protein
MRISILLSASAAIVAAQGVPFSQHGTVTQRAGHNISVDTASPRARRAVRQPGEVGFHRHLRRFYDAHHFDRTSWSRASTGGCEACLAIPREKSPWTFILSSASRVFHSPYPGAQHDVLRADVAPERVSHMETLAYYFPVVGRDSVVLRIHWGETAVPVHIRVSREP